MEELSRLALNDEGFAFDPATGDSYLVNETGLVIIKGLREGRDEAEIAAALAEDYDVATEDAERDVTDFVERLKSFGWAGVKVSA